MKIVEAVDLCKQFGDFKAVDQLSFVIKEGEIIGLIGPNGAGKSTALHIMLGLISRTSGFLRIFGEDPDLARERVFSRLNFTSPYVGLPPRLTVKENLSVYARLYGVRRPRDTIHDLLGQLGATALLDKPTGRLSSGETARVMLCKALLNDPALLILDEPTANLDPCAADDIKALLARRRREHGTAILLTSHNLQQIEELCDRVIVIDRGRVVATGSPLAVTRTILGAERAATALADVFRHLAADREVVP